MSKEAMKLALEEMKIGNYNSAAERLETALAEPPTKAGELRAMKRDFWAGYVPEPDKRQQALDKKAENARELGLDYEPAPVAKPHEQEPVLQDIEQYRLQMAGISTAAIGYWKEGDGIHPDYDTVALRDVAKLYAKYDALYKAQPAQQEPVAWKDAAIRLGEELSSVGPDGYYDMTAEQWLDWAMDQRPYGKNSLPAQRTWVGLTEQERESLWYHAEAGGAILTRFAEAIEAKLKEKNT